MIRSMLAGAALVSAATPVPARPVQVPAPAAQALPAAEALARRYVAEGRTPGIVLAIGAPNGVRFAQAGRGGPDPAAAAVTPDTLWRIYSMTKPITGMAAMMLVEDGRLRLDQPVSDFIPAFRSMRVLVDPERSLASRPARSPITVRQLMTHSSGLGYSINARGPLLDAYVKAGLTPFAVNAAVEAQVRPARPTTLAEFANRAAAQPLVAEPGTRWHYSMGLDVLGRVIEVASGMPFDRFVQTRMFAPLGMTSTYWSVPASEAGRLATTVTYLGGRTVPLDPAEASVFLQPPSFPYGGAGLVSSARDYDRFLAMLANRGTLDGRRVMKPETVTLGMSNLLPAGVFFTGGGTRMGFGAGGSVTLADAPGMARGSFGWSGAAGTNAWVDPVRQRRAIAMVNYFPGEHWPLRADLAAAVAADRP